MTDADPARVGETYKAVTYNVGFGAYTPDYTFFMDGGKSSWAESKESVVETIQGAAQRCRSWIRTSFCWRRWIWTPPAAIMWRRTRCSARALQTIVTIWRSTSILPSCFTPSHSPTESPLSALMTYSRLPITSALRRSLPISESLSKLVDLDRCYSVSRIPVENGRELVVYTVHLSAYGNSDAVREGQKRMLQEDMAGSWHWATM